MPIIGNSIYFNFRRIQYRQSMRVLSMPDEAWLAHEALCRVSRRPSCVRQSEGLTAKRPSAIRVSVFVFLGCNSCVPRNMFHFQQY